jgi:hypothetical protein
MARATRSLRRSLTIEEYQNLPADELYRDELVRGQLVGQLIGP